MEVGLYGGAILVELPFFMDDASTFREIPDTQEVFVQNNGQVSIIFDLLEAVEANDPITRVLTHFKEINSLNGVEDPIGESPITLKSQYGSVGVIKQTEKVLKFGKDPHNLTIYIGVIHLLKAQTDLVVTLNVEDESVANSIFEKLISTIKVKDWGLFI